MKLLLNISILSLIFLFNGCASKITIKALQSSKIEKEKINSIKVERFRNDDINQTESLANKIANKVVDNKRVFTLKNDIFGTDAILTGEVLQSSATYNVYYRNEVDFSRCRYYRYDERTRIKQCMEYYIRYIPCEAKEYNVTTAITLIKPINNQIIFSKTYSTNTSDNVCYDRYFYDYPYMPAHLTAHSDKFRVNSQLADSISNAILDDISPHYIYFDIEIMKELNDNPIYTKTQKQRFEDSVALMEKGNLDLAKYNLESLNQELQGKSFEVLYNLALIYEATNNLQIANNLYNQARTLTFNVKDLDLINYGISRTNLNLEEKIKAKSQLP
ncbi:tetratricopeptide repeat protein [Aliarcobacter butzleri]